MRSVKELNHCRTMRKKLNRTANGTHQCTWFFVLRFLSEIFICSVFNFWISTLFKEYAFFCVRLLQWSNSTMLFRVCSKTIVDYGKASVLALYISPFHIYDDFVIHSHIYNSRQNNKQNELTSTLGCSTQKIVKAVSWILPQKWMGRSFP